MVTTTRVFNFAAGPAVLPLPALEEAQRDLLALPNVGMSVLEISHRSKTFEAIIGECEANIRKLANIPENYHVLFLQGGATTQFSMVAMNLLPPGAWADYIVTGAWSAKAVKEARKVGAVNVAFDGKAGNYVRVPKQDELKFTKGAAYVHVTTNETIHGVEFHELPDVGGATLVADTSSHMFSRPIDVTKYGLIYAGVQKNLGPAGATMVIVRDDLVKKAAEQKNYANLPVMLQYGTHVPEKSLYNTPPVFTIYMVGLVMKWLVGLGGLEAMERINVRKAGKLYAEIDRSGFYRAHAAPDSRSRMNVTFRLPSEELEAKFVKESKGAGLDGLKGHRSVGGLRASIYNAFPEEGVDALVAFMQEFEKKNG
ncbi:MAG TPA: 3-phosphoserine/phosphohydroxythreonine transaminase [Vicinamibacterales bacterium]|nr:3-phosphoserine/phosphohydroxythreonine transaminase [Vicinamibacterales bacterium]